MNAASTVKVNRALPKDYRMTRNKIRHAVQHFLGQMKCSSGLGSGSLLLPCGLQTSPSGRAEDPVGFGIE